MTGPSPRDTRLFDAGARWATEPTDRRGYGDALRAAVERATTPGDDRGRELARALDDLGRLVERIDTGTTTIDVSFATRLARARLDVARYVAAPPETEVSTGSLLDAIGNAVYEAGVGRSGPDPTWHGVATAAERAARAWFARRAAPAETEAVVHDPTTEDEDGRCTEYPDLIDRHGARWVWAIGSEYRARHVLGGWKCRDGAYIRRVFGPVTEVPATPPAPEGEAGGESAPTGFDLGARVWSGLDGRRGEIVGAPPRMVWVRWDDDPLHKRNEALAGLHPANPKPAPAGPQAEGAGETEDGGDG